MDISRPCQPEKLIPLVPWPGFDPSFSGHNDRRAIISEWTRLRIRPLSHRGWPQGWGEMSLTEYCRARLNWNFRPFMQNYWLNYPRMIVYGGYYGLVIITRPACPQTNHRSRARSKTASRYSGPSICIIMSYLSPYVYIIVSYVKLENKFYILFSG